MAIQAHQSVYMIRPTEWSDTIIRPHASAPAKARVRVHAGLLPLSPISDPVVRPFTIYHFPFTHLEVLS
jgi:hypothetical protein